MRSEEVLGGVQVYGVLAVAMGEDTNPTPKGESAQHLALMRQLALNFLRQEQAAKVGIAASQR